MIDEARLFSFGDLWAMAMGDPDFAAGLIDAEEFWRRFYNGYYALKVLDLSEVGS